MSQLRYIEGRSTLQLDVEACNGCGMCSKVCPHRVLELSAKKARIADRDACMECGACVNNCEHDALSVTPGVGCAGAIMLGWVKRSEPSCGDRGAGGSCTSGAL